MGRLTPNSCGCLIAPFVTCILGVVFTVLAQGDLRDYFRSGGWATAEGEVISSRVIESTSDDGGSTYRPEVTYFFFAGDHRIVGNRLYFGDTISTGGGGAQEKVDEYPPGRAIKVRYDPNAPSESVVERRLSIGLIAFGVVGIALIIATPALVIAFILGVGR